MNQRSSKAAEWVKLSGEESLLRAKWMDNGLALAAVVPKDELMAASHKIALVFRLMNEKLGRSMIELQASHSKIEQLAYRDSLTSLPNRRLFMNYVEQAMSMAKRNNTTLAILLLDLDEFKRVNDTMGPEWQDLVGNRSRMRRSFKLPDTTPLPLYL